MKIEKAAVANARQHTIYKTKDGLRRPGVTTVLGVIDKPALRYWANNLGLQGIKMQEYTDALAGIGKLAHLMILHHLKGDDAPTMNGHTPDQVSLAENCFLKFLSWEKAHKVKPIHVEMSLVSEQHLFGGTFDFYGEIDGALTLMDFKTGKGIYEDYWYQLGGYRILLDEHVIPCASHRILNIGRDETENFFEESRDDLSREKRVFHAALELYEAVKEMKR